MASKKKPPLMAAVFDLTKAKTKDPEPEPVVEGYDQWVPRRLKEASDTKIRCLITWADYCYWVKNDSIMSDYTFDLLVREYEARRPDDREFLDKVGMWQV
jgi:hypothetical protein